MKYTFIFTLFIFICGSSSAQKFEKYIVDKADKTYGYYLAQEPEGSIKSTLILFPGFSQKAESIPNETELDEVAYANNILVILISTGNKLYADDMMLDKINNILNDVKQKFSIDSQKVCVGGFSAGGTVAMRYVEKSIENNGFYPVTPKALFLVDAPIDVFRTYEMMQRNLAANKTKVSVQEAEYVINILDNEYGAPMENKGVYKNLSPFSMDPSLGDNEKYLKKVAVRAYHDIDVDWRLKNRGQTVLYRNYVVTAELILRLNEMGNDKAEFMQSFKTGRRSDGLRHPHSWSVVQANECIDWIKDVAQ